MTMRPLWILILHQNGELWIPKSMQPTFSKPFLRCKERYKIMSCSIESISQRLLFFSHSVASDSLWPHGLQYVRLPCPSLSPRVCSNSCPSGWWCHSTISSSITHYSSCPQSFSATRSFPVSQLFTSGSQSIGASASASVLPMNIHYWFPLDGLVGSPCSPRDSRESSPVSQFETINSSGLSLLYGPTLTSVHDYWESHRPYQMNTKQ